jgi:hypothetical protein
MSHHHTYLAKQTSASIRGCIHTMSHHHTYYVTSSYILCHIIIHTTHTYYVTSSYILCHIIIHTMSHHHTYYVTSSYILRIHTMSHHHTYLAKQTSASIRGCSRIFDSALQLCLASAVYVYDDVT